MENNMRWPKKGDKPFVSNEACFNSPTWCSLKWLSHFNLDDSYYADTFKKAGDKIITELERGENFEHPDQMFIPIAYLYRHCLELKMKQIIRQGLELEIVSISDDKLKEIMGSHNLHIIWNLFKSIVTTHWPDANAQELNALKATEDVILDFHKIDNSGQNLRYSENTKGNKTSETLPDFVELAKLKDIFEGIYNLLDACEMEFSRCIEMKNEMIAEYKKDCC